MELKKRLNPRIVFFVICFVAFFGYIIYGLQPAEATNAYTVDDVLSIPSIGLNADVTNLQVENGELNTPDTIVGSYSKNTNKTLLIGHSTGVFSDLDDVKIGDSIKYGDNEYTVTKYVFTEKDAIDMNELLASEEKDTLVIMTCAGTLLGDGDATHRILITATK